MVSRLLLWYQGSCYGIKVLVMVSRLLLWYQGSCYGIKALVMVRCTPEQFETILLQLKALGYDRKLAKFVVVY